MSERLRTGRFRRRLAVAFVLVAAVSAGLVATTSYLFLREERENDFFERSLTEARLARAFVERNSEGEVRPGDVDEIVARFRQAARLDPERVDVVLAVGGSVSQSDARIDLSDVPPTLTDPGTTMSSDRTSVAGRERLVFAAEVAGARLYLFFAMETLESSTRNLPAILVRDWILVVALAALVGYVLARRTLQPIARSSAAAHSLAEGLLDTRLPVEREDEFGALAVAFNEMAAALQEKIEALSAAHEKERRFTSDVAHELRTPLSGLVGAVSLLSERVDEMDPETRWLAERVIRQVGELRGLVAELLEISRFDEGQVALQVEELDVVDLVGDVVRAHEAIRVDVRLDDPQVTTDRRRLERIVSNLVDNAVKHGEPPVRVTIDRTETLLTLVVADSGRGIAEADRERVFDRFFKADPARGGGSGLGLAIARENARLLGGDISLRARDGAGSTFYVWIPLGRRS